MSNFEAVHAGWFRMNFILQDSSATTTVAYLQRVIESELYSANTALTVNEISEHITSDISIEFSDVEIVNALKRGKNSFTYIMVDIR